MASDTFRQDKLKDFTVIRNSIFKDCRLSAKAVGVACKLLSLPPTWDYSVRGIVSLFSDGESSIRSALSELEEYGYLRRERVRDQGKLGGCRYIITDTLKLEKPNVENPHVDNPRVDNHAQLNTKELNTNKLNTNNYDVVVKEHRQIVTYCEQYLGGSLTKQALDDLIGYIDFGMDSELIIRAVDKARDTNNRRWAYVNGILKNWKKDNIKTTEQAIEQDNQFHNKNDKPMSEEERREKRRQEIAEMIKRGMENDNL